MISRLLILLGFWLLVAAGCGRSPLTGEALGATDVGAPEEDAPDAGTPDADVPDDDPLVVPDCPEAALALESADGLEARWAARFSARGPVRVSDVTGLEVTPEGATVLGLSSRGGAALDGEPRWESGPPTEDYIPALMVIEPDGRRRWVQQLAHGQGLGLNAIIQDVAVGDDGTVLAALNWQGEFRAPDGSLHTTPADRSFSLMMSFSGREGLLGGTMQMALASNTLCQSVHAARDGWRVGCFGGAGEGVGMNLERGLQGRWLTAVTPDATPMSYAYLFGVTPPLAGQVFMTVWANGEFGVGGELVEVDLEPSASSRWVVAIDDRSGQPRWARELSPEDPVVQIEPNTGTLLLGNVSRTPLAVALQGLSPEDGSPRWACLTRLEGADAQDAWVGSTFSPRDDGRWLVTGRTSDGLRSFVGVADPREGFAVTRALLISGELLVADSGGGRLVMVLASQQPEATFFGRRFQLASQDKVIVAIDDPFE